MRDLPTGSTCEWATGGPWCVTFTHGITPDDVLTCYGALPGDAQVMPKQEALQLGVGSYRAGTGESVLRVGSLGDWSFCYEEWGILGGMPGSLSALSQHTETFSVATDGAGMDTFEHWRDGRCTEVFEPDNPDTRLPPPHSWQDALRERREATGDSEPLLVAAVRVIGDHMGVVLDDATLDGPLPTVLLGDGGPLRKPHSGGRGRGRGVLVPLTEESGLNDSSG